MSYLKRTPGRPQTGFSLVEIMVALVIGMLVTLVITQVMSTFEEQKRGTSGSTDAQTNGSIGLYAIQREALMAGYGLPLFDSTNSPLRCLAMTPAATDLSLVTITDGGTTAGSSDKITIRYGDSMYAGTSQLMMSTTAAPKAVVATILPCKANDDALVVSGTNCTLTKVNAVAITGTEQAVTLASSVNVATNAALSCLGTWRQMEFRVNDNADITGHPELVNQMMRLERVAGQADVVTPIGSDILAIKAQYGVSAVADDPTVTLWVRATNSNANSADDWTAASLRANPDLRNRIKAIRVAILARNNLVERDEVTQSCSSTTLPNPTGLCAWEGTAANPAPAFNLTNVAQWKHYRYRVFEAVIPLRNMVWARGTL